MRAIPALILCFIIPFSNNAVAGLIDFGSAEQFTMAAASSDPWQGNLLLGSEAHIFGAVAASRTLELGDGVVVEGDACATVANNWGAKVIGAQGHCTDFDLLAASISSAAAQVKALSGISLGDIIETTTIDASQGSVFELSSLHLGSGEWLTLSGSSDDNFIFNVTGLAKLGSGAGILLTGGLTADNVIFNFEANPVAHSFEIGAAQISGTFLSDGRSMILGDGATLNNTRFYSTASIVANVQDVSYQAQDKPVDTPKPVPTPGIVSLFLLALLGFGISQSKRQN